MKVNKNKDLPPGMRLVYCSCCEKYVQTYSSDIFNYRCSAGCYWGFNKPKKEHMPKLETLKSLK